MLELTPLEQTTAVREIIQLSRDEGVLIGQINMAQRVMRQSLTPREKLVGKSVEELSEILAILESELNMFQIGST